MPWGFLPVDHILGPGLDSPVTELVSPRENEAKIILLIRAIDYILDRYKEIMQYTSRILLCWLRSTKPQIYYPKPFTLVALKSSKKKYR
jgi:hypothetical protein